MKYFVKYLPIEGEIREEHIGQHIQRGDNRFLLQSNKKLNKPGEYGSDKIELLNYRGYKVVKLFLCSRDIQVGDKDVIITPDIPVHSGMNGDVKHWIKGERYKVIGEISPDATWVKEGDEFDDNNIMVERIGFIHIKGPCGHFH